MLNMIKLDWLGMKKYRLKFVTATLIACFVAIISDAGVILPFMVFGMFDVSLYCFDAEERGKLNNLYLTLPISRSTLISARYVMSLFFQLIGIAAGIVLTFVFSAIMRGRTLIGVYTFSPSAETIVLLVCFSLLYCAILSLFIHPILFKKGYAKAKVIGYIIPMIVPFALIIAFIVLAVRVEAVGEFYRSALEWTLNNTSWTAIIMLAAAALLLAASFALSQKVYAKREF